MVMSPDLTVCDPGSDVIGQCCEMHYAGENSPVRLCTVLLYSNVGCTVLIKVMEKLNWRDQ